MQRRTSTQDISWFLDLDRSNQLEMNPPYQRRSVWSMKDRRFFLDTIFRGYPCPPVFLHKFTDQDKTRYAVVDGKQRLDTILGFAKGTISLSADFGDTRFNGKNWDSLGPVEKQHFWDYVLPVEFLVFNEQDVQEVNHAFDRLNRNMRKLDRQELRHARWDGWLAKFLETEIEDSFWKKFGISTKARYKRMKDVQFISELMLVLINKKQEGFDQDNIDNAYAKYNDPDDIEFDINTDLVEERWRQIKAVIDELQGYNECITKYADTYAQFYTLWTLIALYRENLLTTTSALAEAYATFMQRVNDLSNGDSSGADKDHQIFLEASRGASTDLSQRQKRFTALLPYLTQK